MSAGEVQIAALAAHDAGLCVVRVRSDGTKRPVDGWKQYQAQRPERAIVERWFSGTRQGVGVVCGAVSGGLEMFEFEGRAVRENVLHDFLAAGDAAGLTPLVERITSGYAERTPSGGLHWLYWCDEVDRNTKLARREANDDELAENPDDKVKVLIETRGEGGFTVIAPSNGTTHPNGGKWELISGGPATIATIAPEERAALFELARRFDQLHEEDAPASSGVHRGERWTELPGEDRPGDIFNERHTCAEVLLRAGFTEHSTDPKGVHFTRPGKNTRKGSSATVWADNGTTSLWSTSIDAKAEAIGERNLSAWQLHVHLNHRGDFTRAAREYGAELDRTGTRPTAGTDDDPDPSLDQSAGPPVLPEEFWQSRKRLSDIRQAARARRSPPDAVLGAVLARIGASMPHTLKLAPMIGGAVGLSYFVSLIARPGGGKTTGASVAGELVPSSAAVSEVPAGTGEGLVETLFDKDDDGRKVQTRYSLLVTVDEGAALMEVASRQGSTTMSMLRQGYTDGPIGNTNASPERRRIVPAGQYVIGLIVGFQPEKAAPLLGDADAGTPQRFLWVAAHDPGVPDRRPPWPDWEPWRPPEVAHRDPVHLGNYRRHLVGVPDEVADELDERRVRQLRGENHDADPLDGHAGLVRLKTAALLALLDGRLDINLEDWHLARVMYDTSAGVRSHVVAVLAAERRALERSEHRRAAARDAHLEDAAATRALASGVRSIGRRVHKLGRATRRQLHAAVKSTHRNLVPLDDMIDRAEAEGVIARDGDEWVPGRRSA